MCSLTLGSHSLKRDFGCSFSAENQESGVLLLFALGVLLFSCLSTMLSCKPSAITDTKTFESPSQVPDRDHFVIIIAVVIITSFAERGGIGLDRWKGGLQQE